MIVLGGVVNQSNAATLIGRLAAVMMMMKWPGVMVSHHQSSDK